MPDGRLGTKGKESSPQENDLPLLRQKREINPVTIGRLATFRFK
jgi:hypothetical protein